MLRMRTVRTVPKPHCRNHAAKVSHRGAKSRELEIIGPDMYTVFVVDGDHVSASMFSRTKISI